MQNILRFGLFNTLIFISPIVSELCTGPLGVEDGSIPDEQLTESSKWDPLHGADGARLNSIKTDIDPGAWAPLTNDQHQWIQVNLGTLHKVCGVITQGRNGVNQWVTSYEVLHSFDGIDFEPVTDTSYQVAEFVGNSDRDTAVTNIFHNPVHAQFIRINPTSWKSYICLRFEVLGCPDIEQSTYYKSFNPSSACQHRSVTSQNSTGSCIRCAVHCMRVLRCKAFKYDEGECHIYTGGANEYFVAFQLGCKENI